MVSPLHGFISEDGRLFQNVDKVGIATCKDKGVLKEAFDCLLGKTIRVSYAGDTVVVDRKSAENFFLRNKHLLEECEKKGDLSLPQKILFLIERKEKLPHGILPETAVGGQESKRCVIGSKQRFVSLARALQKNAFEVERLLEIIRQKEENMVSLEREEVFRHLIEENKSRLGELQSSCGNDTIKALADYLITKIREDLLS
jgi:hypothetical protein